MGTALEARRGLDLEASSGEELAPPIGKEVLGERSHRRVEAEELGATRFLAFLLLASEVLEAHAAAARRRQQMREKKAKRAGAHPGARRSIEEAAPFGLAAIFEAATDSDPFAETEPAGSKPRDPSRVGEERPFAVKLLQVSSHRSIVCGF